VNLARSIEHSATLRPATGQTEAPTQRALTPTTPGEKAPEHNDGPPNKKRPRAEHLIKTGSRIASERPGDDDKGYMHSIMCQVGLPRSKVDGISFERSSGGAALLVEAGKLWDGRKFVQQPIPYGATPRLILAWMNTYAVRFNSPEIPIGDSASEFMRMLGHKSVNGGLRGSYTTFRKQVQALSACRMTLGFNAGGRAHTYEGTPIKHFEAWIASEDQPQRLLWPGSVTFSQDYYQTLKEHAVPLDLRAFMSLKGSALDLDVYTWLAQRLHRIEGRPRILHWANMRDQFGQEYTGVEADKNFKKKFLPSLQRVLTVYPEAKVKKVTGGIMLQASPPPIPYK
jgi:hypothetical protein